MKYLVATFHIEPNGQDMQTCLDLLADGAAMAGFEAFDEQEGHLLKAYVQKDLFDKQVLDEQIEYFPLPHVDIHYTVEDAEDRDWNEEWEEQGFAPINIGNRLIIYDAKHPERSTSHAAMEIGIEAKQAFGTGTHETTQMIVAMLMDMNMKLQRVLDCGTGTGILGIVASKLGARDIVAYDIDDWSVDNARHNAQLNGVENMQVLLGNASVITHISGCFDIVLANINRNILLADMKAFRSVMNAGGYLILSGFYEDDAPMLIAKAEELGLKEIERRINNNWCCLVFSVK